MIFKTWMWRKVRYLAILNTDRNFHIMDEYGNNYGTFGLIETFKKNQQKHPKPSKYGKIGKCRLQVITVPEE